MSKVLRAGCLVICCLAILSLFVACGDGDKMDAPQENAVSSVSAESNGSVTNVDSNNSDLSSAESTVSNNAGNGQVSTGDTVSGNTNSNSGTANNDSSVPVNDSSPTVWLKATVSDDVVTVTVSMKNNPGLTGFDLKLNYDKEIVTPQTFKNADTIDITSNLMQPNADCNGQVTAVYVSANGFKTDGELFSVEFKVKDKNALNTRFSLKTEANSFVDLNVKYVTFATQDVSIALK